MVSQTGKPQRKRLGDILVEAGVISAQQLQEALSKQKVLGKRLGKVLVDTGITTEDSIATTLAAEMSLMALYNKIIPPTIKISQMAPKVTFALLEGNEVEAVYAYCNLHSLWKA